MPLYSSAHAFLNSAAFDVTSPLPSRISTFDRGFARLKYHATWHARSYGPGGQRYGATGIEIANTPPSGIASSCRRSATVCGPAFQACRIAPARRRCRAPGTSSHMKSTPGDRTSRS